MWRSELLLIQLYRGKTHKTRSRTTSVSATLGKGVLRSPIGKLTKQNASVHSLNAKIKKQNASVHSLNAKIEKKYTEIRSLKKIGKGDYGETYLINFSKLKINTEDTDIAIKFVKIRDPQHFDNECSAVELNREAQSLIYESSTGQGRQCVCPVLHGGYKNSEFTINGKQIFWFTMPVLQKFEFNQVNIDNIVKACDKLTRGGFLHNDFHMGNMMMLESAPIIIDFGFMKKFIPIPRFNQVLVFAQISTFFDNCNENTECITAAGVYGIFAPYRVATSKLFQSLSHSTKQTPLQYAKKMIEYLIAEYPNIFHNQNGVTVGLQLILAQFANKYFIWPDSLEYPNQCGYHGDDTQKLHFMPICEQTQGSVSDIVYAIRDPGLVKLRSDNRNQEIWDILEKGKPLPMVLM